MNKNRINLFFPKIVFYILYFGVLFFAAIPSAIAPYSISDIILISLSTLSLFNLNKIGTLYIFCAIIWFIVSSFLGEIRGVETSAVTGLSLGLKWAGAFNIYIFLVSKADSKWPIFKTLTILQMLVLVSLLTNTRPFPGNFYSGTNGVFQASADGGYYLICSLGLFLNLYKIYASRLILFNILISLVSLILVDSRVGSILGALVLIYYLLSSNKTRPIILFLSIILYVCFYFQLISIPTKIDLLISRLNDPIQLIENDLSMLIRINNFANAFDMTSIASYFLGNGAKFYKLGGNYFFEQNNSLDNSYLYLFLSFGIPGLILFYLVFLSDYGFNIKKRGIFCFLCLAFPLMQDTFSNSFSLLGLSIFLAIDTIFKNFKQQTTLTNFKYN